MNRFAAAVPVATAPSAVSRSRGRVRFLSERDDNDHDGNGGSDSDDDLDDGKSPAGQFVTAELRSRLDSSDDLISESSRVDISYGAEHSSAISAGVFLSTTATDISTAMELSCVRVLASLSRAKRRCRETPRDDEQAHNALADFATLAMDIEAVAGERCQALYPLPPPLTTQRPAEQQQQDPASAVCGFSTLIRNAQVIMLTRILLQRQDYQPQQYAMPIVPPATLQIAPDFHPSSRANQPPSSQETPLHLVATRSWPSFCDE